MIFGLEKIENDIAGGSQMIENVKEYVYLGSLLTWDNDCTKDIHAWVAKANGAMAGLEKSWRSKKIS